VFPQFGILSATRNPKTATAAMSTFPSISHHLFAEAAVGKGRPARKDDRAAKQPVTLKGVATTLPLELLDAVQPLPSGMTRQLRAAGES
jgi:hypothetical protein